RRQAASGRSRTRVLLAAGQLVQVAARFHDVQYVVLRVIFDGGRALGVLHLLRQRDRVRPGGAAVGALDDARLRQLEHVPGVLALDLDVRDTLPLPERLNELALGGDLLLAQEFEVVRTETGTVDAPFAQVHEDAADVVVHDNDAQAIRLLALQHVRQNRL